MKILANQYSGPFILASQSPRRADLLTQIGMQFKIVPSHIREDEIDETDPEKHVKILSTLKAKVVAKKTKRGIIIGADTIVVLDGHILGKPVDEKDAFLMLSRLSGRTHEVVTGFSLIERPSDRLCSDVERTRVRFRDLGADEIDAYISSGQPMDKAGAYGIQDLSAIFVDRIEGCYFNVVGFPLARFYKNLLSFLHSE